jgi:ABC-type nitrate/sulfonate/bicarbonate transport system permease component
VTGSGPGGAATRLRRLAKAGGRAMFEYLPAAVLLAALVAIWELWVRLRDTRPYILPAPSRIWSAFMETRDVLPDHTWTTVSEALLGLAIAAGAGILLALVLALTPFARRVLYPILVVSQTIPMIVLAPLLIIWFGFGMAPKVVVVALFGFFPICIATADALLSADRDMVDLVRSMGGGRLARMRYVLVPSAIPAFFAGLKIAAAYAILGAVVGEYVGASSGLGIFINRSQTGYRTDQVFVGVVVIALISIALFGIVHLIARLATPWLYATRGEKS